MDSKALDAYVRLAPPGARCHEFGCATRSQALLLVDLDCAPEEAKRTLQRIRELPQSSLMGVTKLVARLPVASTHASASKVLDELIVLLDQLVPAVAPLVRGWGVVHGAIGQPISIRWSAEGAPSSDDSEVLHRLRRAELISLLDRSDAIWEPSEYHFKLPGGKHTSSFVRVADAISDHRDADVLAFWCQPSLKVGRGVVFDNRGLVALALGIRAMADSQEVLLGPSLFLDHYPDAQSEVEVAIREAAKQGGGVLAVLSVSNAGETKERLRAALRQAGQPDWSLQVLVDKTKEIGWGFAATEPDFQETWIGLGDGKEAVYPSDRCLLCTSKRGRVVGIDPRFFNGMALPDPTLVVPRPASASAASEFWTACDLTGSIALEHAPSGESAVRRSALGEKSGRMGVYVSLDRLVACSPTDRRDELGFGVKALMSRRADRYEETRPSDALSDVDVLIVASADADRTGYENYVGRLKSELGLTQAKSYPVDSSVEPEEWDEKAVDAIKTAKHVLVLTLGVVTGYTLQRLLVGCQEHMRAAKSPNPLTGLVLHARPSSSREWNTLRNSFGRRLFAIFTTLMPSSSPLSDESEVLELMSAEVENLEEEWSTRLVEFIRGRQDLANGLSPNITSADGAEYVPLLWGMPNEDVQRARIRQHSIFGHKLGAATLLAAIGSVIHTRRDETQSETGPSWHLFEMPAILRSYYDPLILAAMIRWLQPAEMWWGKSSNAECEALRATLERSTNADLAVLVPELLLAAAQGKIPEQAAAEIDARAETLLKDPPTEFEESDLVAIGAGLLAWRTERLRRRETVAESVLLPTFVGIRT